MKKQPPERLQSFSIELLEQILQSTTEGIMITNEKMQITMVNNAFETLTGYRSSEILGKYPNILQSGKQDADFYKVMWSKIRSNGSWRGEIWNRRKNGEIYPEILSIYSGKLTSVQLERINLGKADNFSLVLNQIDFAGIDLSGAP